MIKIPDLNDSIELPDSVSDALVERLWLSEALLRVRLRLDITVSNPFYAPPLEFFEENFS